MPDKYRNYAELSKSEVERKDFRITCTQRAGTFAVIAPHGGSIEPGTSELVEAIAGEDHSHYAFEGIKDNGNGSLHITSTHFDEPTCVQLVGASKRALAIHGKDDDSQSVFIGGRDLETIEVLRDSLERNGFIVNDLEDPRLLGRETSNICNRTNDCIGVQFELSQGLRETFFESLRSNGRQRKTEAFHKFVAAVREGLELAHKQLKPQEMQDIPKPSQCHHTDNEARND
jgi:phage replication-related protein YjqB (UPF0714/DUF867 family)